MFPPRLSKDLMVASERVKKAKAQWLEAVERAFPLGSLVISYHGSASGRRCRVKGHRTFDGYVRLENTSTLKMHWAHPSSLVLLRTREGE